MVYVYFQYIECQKELNCQIWVRPPWKPMTPMKQPRHIAIPPADSTLIHNAEGSSRNLAGSSLAKLRRELLKNKVEAFLRAVADKYGLLPGPSCVYDEFVLGEDCRTLYLKDGFKRVTWKNDSTKYRVLSSLGMADFIRTHLFPEYNTCAKPTLAVCLRKLFHEQGVTIASTLTVLGFIVSTIVLAIQNALGGTGGITPTPTPPNGGVTAWVKKQLQNLGKWLKALAGKAAAALPGIIGAIVSWLLKTVSSGAVWFAEHLWALAAALVAVGAVWLRDYRAR